MKKSTKIIGAAAITVAALAMYPAQAHAQPGAGENGWVDQIVCSVEDAMLTGVPASDVNVLLGIMDGLDERFAGELNSDALASIVINSTVQTCPHNWPAVDAAIDYGATLVPVGQRMI